MRFIKKNDIYKVIRITGCQDNILGVTFDNKNNSDNNIEVIEWDFPISQQNPPASKEEVLKQVLSGLESVNESLETSYKLSKIYFSPADSSRNRAYSALIGTLIRDYHHGTEFKEV